MRIYLDHNATTPPDPLVTERMAQAFREVWGNASSVHHFGQQAKAALDEARGAVAGLLGADASEIVFTCGGTESDNIAIRGAAEALEASGRRHLITSAIEHEAVLTTMKALAKRGARVTILPVDASGILAPDRLREALTDDTALVSVMHANNEIGTVQPIAELAALAHERGALFHTDAVQSAGKLPLDVRSLGVDLLSIAGHKFYGPKGTGALWLKRGVRLIPPMTGGRQERNRRAGTENVPALVGLGVAADVANRKLASEADRLGALRDRLEAGILAAVPGSARNGAASPRVPNTTNLSIEGVESESLLIGLDLAGIAVSSGSACSSGTLEPSHVLKAMGLSHGRTLGSIRFSLGTSNTDADIDHVIAVLPPLVAKLRSLTTVSGRK
ncbi:MAG: aminotransferase class V-fold PLP-dependent enzyme [Acidobacteriota bacterium]|nr:aminotransferase class V-fold PLP-dependent enzyme [Acidobacteriota bacterium]